MPMPALLARRPAVLFGIVAAAVVVAAATTAVRHSDGHSKAATSRGVSVKVGAVTAVDLQAVPGHLSVVSTTSNQATLTGVLDWTGQHAPAATSRLSDHRLSLSYRCATASPCTADWRLTVPQHAAVTLQVPSGYVTVAGIAGPLQITASSVDVSATGLASPRLEAAITSGHLSAVFRSAPQQVSISLTSAQSTVKLPANVAYAVSDQVTSGYMQVGVPESASSSRTVTVTVVSGEMALLPT
jgi:hypothetical protein